MRPVLLQLGPLRLYGYGAMVVLGGILSFWFLRRRADKIGLRGDDFWLIVNAVIVGGFVGGRAMQLLAYTPWTLRDFLGTAFSPWGGVSALGAFLGVPAAAALACRWRGLPFFRLLDTLCVMAPFWHVFGRLGCFLAGCCYGRPTSLPWGVAFRDPRSLVPPQWLGVPLHPTQLYEAFGNALIAAFLYDLLRRTEDDPPGLVAGCYFIAYGLERFLEEFFRGDGVALGLFGWTSGQGAALVLAAAGAAMLARRSMCFRRC